MKKHLFPSIFALVLAPALASAASVTPSFVDHGANTTTAQNTRMYRADLSGLGLTEIGSLTITDSNSRVGGSPGIYSGFDLDALFLDRDGDLATDDDRYFASDFIFSAGSLRPGGYAPPSPSGGPTNGSISATAVDEAFATLNEVDARYFSTGSLTLGDGGSLVAAFASMVEVSTSLYLFVGEVSGDPGEQVTGLVEVSDTVPPGVSVVPLPATAPLLLGALGLLGLRRARKS